MGNCRSLSYLLLLTNSFAVSREMLEPFLEGKTMDKALEERRLFIIDYVILEGLEITDPTLEVRH